MSNMNMNGAKMAKKDEFYTQMTDIEKECHTYRDQFRGKVVFCNCDDPESSNFWKYFDLKFDFFGLKGLISTHFDYEKPTYMLEKRAKIGRGGGHRKDRPGMQRRFSLA